MRAPYKGGSGQTGTEGKVGEFCCLSKTNHREWRGSPLCNLADLKLAWVRVDANDKCASMYVTAAARLRALLGDPQWRGRFARACRGRSVSGQRSVGIRSKPVTNPRDAIDESRAHMRRAMHWRVRERGSRPKACRGGTARPRRSFPLHTRQASGHGARQTRGR